MHETRTPRLADRLDKAGIEILTLGYECIELNGGGIHCSTGPLARDPS
jgi:N-dimethylarginine dimethylaminohydrolase